MPVSNRLLSVLPADERATLLGMCKPVALPVRTMLLKAGGVPEHVHFLTSGIACVMSPAGAGEAVETGMVGREGVSGAFHALGDQPSISNWYMQVPGSGLRLEFSDFRQAFDSMPGLHRRVLEYAQYRTLVLQQLAACNRAHQAGARLARWLMMAVDRSGTSELPFTQNVLAHMLGTRRTTVTLMAGELQRHGVIELQRSQVRVRDRDRLVESACECYPLLFRLFQQLYQTSAVPKSNAD